MKDSQSNPRIVQLPWLSVLRFSGPDAVPFLQGQLTSDVGLLKDGRTQLAAFNTPQGRVIALLRLRETADGISALLPGDLAEAVVQRLKRYVLRARVKIEVDADWLVGGQHGATPDRPRPFDGNPSDEAGLLRFASTGGRNLLAAPVNLWQTDPALAQPTLTEGPTGAWMAADIEAGLPQVFAATSELHVAQMLNLDLLDGISFQKGCYTGQEIIARTQHRGRIKRRMLRYGLEEGPPPPLNAALIGETGKVGAVVASAATAAGAEILAVTALEVSRGSLTLEDGRAAIKLPMPYGVHEND